MSNKNESAYTGSFVEQRIITRTPLPGRIKKNGMQKKPHMSVNRVDSFDFHYAPGRTVLAMDRDYSQHCLVQTIFLSNLLCLNLNYQYVVMFNETFSRAEIAGGETRILGAILAVYG